MPMPPIAPRSSGFLSPDNRRHVHFTELTKTPAQILAMEVKAGLVKPPPMAGTPEKGNLVRYCDFHLDRGHSTNDCYALKKQIEDAVQSGKLSHLVKDIRAVVRQGNKNPRKGKEIHVVRTVEQKTLEIAVEGWMDQVITFPPISKARCIDEPMIVTANIESHKVHRILVDDGSATEIMFELCFLEMDPTVKSRIRRVTTPLIGFAGETRQSMREICLPFCIGEGEQTRVVN